MSADVRNARIERSNGSEHSSHLDPVVRPVFTRLPHFTAHSGYELIASHLAPIESVSELPRGWPRARILKYPQAVISALAGSNEYSYGSVALELLAAAHMRASRNQLIHFLYGENYCRYTPLLNGWRGHRVVATFHQTPSQLRERLQHTGHLRRLSAAIILGENQRSFFERFLPRERIFFVPHGVDSVHFRPPDTRPIGTDSFCLCVGGHIRDFETLRASIELVNQRRTGLQFEVIARRGQAACVADLPNVRLRSWVTEEELLGLYQQASVTVLPLIDAVASNVLLETMACGSPVVVTAVGAVEDYAGAGEVILADYKDPVSLAEGVLKVVGDPDAALHLGKAARAKAEQLDHRLMAARLMEAYRTIMDMPAFEK